MKKIFDCFMYNNEDLILEIAQNLKLTKKNE